MTILWFLIWFVSDLVGDREVITFDPVNWWAGFLLLAAALDLNKSYVVKRRYRDSPSQRALQGTVPMRDCPSGQNS